MAFKVKDNYKYGDLVELVELLRSERGCPWDRKQTHESVRMNFLEEAYEVCEAIDLGDDGQLCEELGDVLLQVVFHAQIAEERGVFSADSVANAVCAKLVERHPHIFAGLRVDGVDEVLVNWDEIKRNTKEMKTHAEAMRGVAKSLPALMRAEKLQRKAAKAGFDWPDDSGALDKLQEEIREFSRATDKRSAEEEFGDLLLAAVGVAKFHDIDPELALTKACDKFIIRFEAMERSILESGREMSDMTLDEMDMHWERQKHGAAENT